MKVGDNEKQTVRASIELLEASTVTHFDVKHSEPRDWENYAKEMAITIKACIKIMTPIVALANNASEDN